MRAFITPSPPHLMYPNVSPLLLSSPAVHAHRDCLWLWVPIGHGVCNRDAFSRADPHALAHRDP